MYYFTPGPSQLYPTLETHIVTALRENIGAISHRSKSYQALHQKTVEGLKSLWDIPAEYSIFFMASATEIWERLLQNCVSRQSLHFTNGAFSERFYTIGKDLHKDVQQIQALWGKGFEWDSALDIPQNVELLNFTHNESSTGVQQPLEVIYKYREAFPHALITLDVVSSAPCPVLDFTKLDATYFSVQKGFGLPAGLGVLIASPRLIEYARKLELEGMSTGSYHRFSEMYKKSLVHQTPETPNVWNIYLLGQVIEDMHKKGLTNIRAEVRAKAKALYEAIVRDERLSIYVKDPLFRSETVVVADTATPSETWIEYFKSKGFVIGNGYERMKSKQIRISNFPTHSVEKVEEWIDLLQKMP